MKNEEIHFYKKQSSACISCGKCCGAWPVPVSAADVRRISALDFSDWNGKADSYFKKTLRGFYLRKRNGHCIFLDTDGLCIMHKKYGLAVKPLACRLYPFDIYKWEDGSVSASLRYDCPAVAAGKKENISSVSLFPVISAFAMELFEYRGRFAKAEYSGELHPAIPRLREIAAAYQKILLHDRNSPERSFYAAACLLNFHSVKKNSSDVMEAETFGTDAFAFVQRSREHLSGVMEDISTIRKDHRIRFRYLLWCFLRDDGKSSLLNHFPTALAAVHFLLGKGTLEKTVLHLPVRASSLQQILRKCKASPDALEPYFRFLRGRLESLHFCGTPALGLTFEEGMSYLLVSFPVVYTVACLLALKRGDFHLSSEDVREAVVLIDHGFLRSPLYARRNTRRSVVRLVKSDDFAFLLKLLKS